MHRAAGLRQAVSVSDGSKQGGRRRRFGRVDIHGQDFRLQLPRLLLLGLRRLLIFLDVELPQKHNRLFAKDTTGDWVWLVDARAGTISMLVATVKLVCRLRTRSGYLVHPPYHQIARSNIQSRRLGFRTGGAWRRT
jgi:hypothetical protein